MGVRVHVYLSHDLPQFDDRETTLARLEAALPAALAVHDYWPSGTAGRREDARWLAEPIIPRLANQRWYEGPGPLFLHVTPTAALITTSARWRGFLSIEPLRNVHLAAFRAVALALGSTTMAICSDSRYEPWEVFVANGSQEHSIAEMRRVMGLPQPTADFVEPIELPPEHPGIWLFEILTLPNTTTLRVC